MPVRPLLAVRKIQDSLVPSTTSDSYLVAKDVVVDDLCEWIFRFKRDMGLESKKEILSSIC